MRHSLALLLMASAAQAEPRFEDRSEQLGLSHEYNGDWEHFVGGGVAIFDCNGDALPEVFVAGGAGPSVFFENHSSSSVELKKATPDALRITGATGAYPIDLDNDNQLDLVVLRVGENLIFRGRPDCEFEPFSPAGFDGGTAWTTAFSAVWEAGQTRPTLAFGNYVDRDDPDGPFGTCDHNTLFRPAGDSYQKFKVEPGFCALSILFSDWGRQGRADLRISNDRHYYVKGGQEQLWAMETPPRLYDSGDGWASHALWGMGIASRDITGDGRPEIMLTSMGDQRFQALVSDTEPTFSDVDYDKGTTAHRPYTGDDGRPSTGWHAQFGDVDNDGRDDLFIAKGNVEQMPGSAMQDPNNLLMQSQDGTFQEAGLEAGIASMARSRGAGLVDLNADGRLDLVVVNRRAPLEIYQNITEEAGSWIAVEIAQSRTNRFGIGAWIELRSGDRHWHREVTIGGGHASGSLVPHHFGLGDAQKVEIQVTWPDQTKSQWLSFDANQYIKISRN